VLLVPVAVGTAAMGLMFQGLGAVFLLSSSTGSAAMFTAFYKILREEASIFADAQLNDQSY
jgi:hypothetical protein